MKLLKAFILSAFLFSVFAFRSVSPPDFIGTYGISKNDPAKLALTINADNTFTYQDFSDLNNKINAEGTWELKNKTIILKNFSSPLPIATKLRVEKDGRAVKYTKGFAFYRLAKL